MPRSLTKGTRPVVCFGEILLRLGAPGRELLLQSPQFEVFIGGAEANVAVGLARLGHAVEMVSVVADNELGRVAVGELRKHGIGAGNVRFDEGRMGLYFLSTGALQRPSEVLYDRADSAFSRAGEYSWEEILATAGWLHVSGVTPAVGPHAADAAQAAVECATRLGVPVSFDGNFRSKLWSAWEPSPGPRLRALAEHAQVLIANHRDIDVMLGGDCGSGSSQSQEIAAMAAPTLDQAQVASARAFDAFPRLQVFAGTRREELSVDHHRLSGFLCRRGGTLATTERYELAGIVDRIGAGDAFAAGLLHGLLDGESDAIALGFGIAAACLKHATPGDFGRATRAELAAFDASGGFSVRR